MKNKLSVIVTRPEGQAENLIALLDKNNIKAIHVPALSIHFKKTIVSSHSDIIIFTSSNAVLGFFNSKNDLENSVVMAIGDATRQALNERGVASVRMPTNFSSEGLLQLAELQAVKNKTITIVAGEGGRDLLEKELMARGAKCTRLAVYHRSHQENLTKNLNAALNLKIDYIVASSGEGLKALLQVNQEITTVKLVVISQRMLALAIELGFANTIKVASNASDQALCNAIVEEQNDRVKFID